MVFNLAQKSEVSQISFSVICKPLFRGGNKMSEVNEVEVLKESRIEQLKDWKNVLGLLTVIIIGVGMFVLAKVLY